jgi:hypothetical protein
MFTDSEAAAAYIIARLKTLNWGVVPLDDVAIPAKISRVATADSVTLKISSRQFDISAEWRGLTQPRWGDGPSPNYPGQHQWAFMLEASEARLSLNGRAVDGETYPDERFRSMFGAPVSSASIGLAEVSVEMPGNN